MLVAFRHSLKLSLINIVGFIISYMFYFMGALLIVAVAFILGASGSLLSMFATDFEDPTQILENSIAAGAMFIFALLIMYLMLIFIASLSNSIWIGGTYAFSLEASQSNHSSMGTYFSKGFSHMFKLTWMSLLYTLFVAVPVLLILFIPFIILEVLGIVPNVLMFLLFVFLVVIGSIFLFAIAIHSPIFIIQERAGAWKSITLSIQLIFRSFGQTILSVLAYLVSSIIIVGVSLLLIVLIAFMMALFTELTGNEVIPKIFGTLLIVVIYLLFIPVSISFPVLWISDRYNKKLRHHLFPPTDQQNQGDIHFKMNQQSSYEQPYTFDSPSSSHQPPKLDL